jgi:RNA-directed DNA polymerase
MTMSKKTLQRERDSLRERTDCSVCYKPIPLLIAEMNQHLKGWANYFKLGYPRKGYRRINSYVRERLTIHLRRRSQRPFRPPKGISYYQHLQSLGLVYL